MKSVRICLDEDLLDQVDRVVAEQGSTWSAFARAALRNELSRLTAQKEQRHRDGYARQPVQPGEFDDWGREQAWPS